MKQQLADLLGESSGIEAIKDKIARLLARQQDARRLPPVLIEGETGTGKGLLARLLHKAGPRPQGPFVDVNCAAIPETLLEAEMFGFERGAFTDARRAKPGLFQAANRGTIFLDEVALLSEGLQAKLLKVLEERSVRRLGATRDEAIDVWILTATNEDLKAAIPTRRFREDLYHRLAVLTLSLPPLRARGDDIMLLAEHYLERACADYGVSTKTLLPDARAALRAYPWPGNVRELANLMERVALLSSEPDVTAAVLGLTPVVTTESSAPAPAGGASGGASSLDDAVRDRVVEVLRQTSWNISRTAAVLGISRNTLRARIEKYGLRSGEAPAPSAPAPVRRAAPAPQPGAPPPAPRPVRAAAAAAPTPAPPVQIVSAVPTPVVWERRRITMLRAVLITPSAPESPLENSRSLELLLDKVRSFGGSIEGRSPLGLAAAFGLDPTEDAPSRAAHAAMAMVKALVRGRQDVGAGAEVKVAVHTSHMLVGQGAGASELELDGRQASLHALAALIDRGAVDTVTVSDATAPFLTRGFEFDELEASASSPGRAFALVDRGRPGPGRGPASPFVGRQRELEFLSSRLESAMRGQGQIVGISGEAGIGKSRLIYEFRESLAGKPVTCLEGLCHSHGASIPYLPVLDVLRASCGITDDDSPGAMADKARSSVLEAGMDLLETAPYLLHLLDIEADSERFAALAPDVAKARIFEILRQLVLRKARQTPLVVVIEDLHWIDRTSEEYLAFLAETVPGARLLIVCTYRDGYRPPWMDKSYATQVALQPLAPAESLQILRAVLGTERSRDELDAVIVVKAEGNPLFVEELARTVREQAGLVTTMAVPDTIEDVLGGRIDRLAAEDRRLLEMAAVVGKDVAFSIVHAIAGMPVDTLRRTFERLKSAEFLYETSLGPEPEYTFKHTLTHEVAYGRLLGRERRALHGQIADAIERLSPDRVGDNVERLAHHTFEGAVWEKAHGYLHQAGAKAFVRCAHQEAAACYERALVALGHTADTREKTVRTIDLQLSLRSALQPIGEFGRILETLGNAETLARSLGDQQRLGRVVSFLADYSCRMGDHDRALEYGRQALAIAEPLDDLALRLRSNLYLGQIHYARGDYRTAITFLEWNVAALEGGREREFFGHSQLPSVHARTNLAWCYAELGEFETAARRGREGILIAESVDHPYSLANACAGIGGAYARRGDLAEAIPILERGLELCRSWTLSLWFPRVATSLGEVFVLAGRAAEAVALLEQAEHQSRTMRVVRGRGPLLTCLAEAYLAAGRRENALESVRVARELAREHGEGGHEAWALRLEGEIALRGELNELTVARERLPEALARASGLEMRPLAAHCRAALGRLHLRAGKREDAERYLQDAAALYRELGMTLWLGGAVAALAGLR